MVSETWLFLSKLLPLAVQPLCVALVFAVLSLCAMACRRNRLARILAVTAISIVGIASMPIVGERAYATLERQYPPMPLSDTPKADVAIVLGGAIKGPMHPRTEIEMTDSSSRVLHAFRLYRAAKIDRILIAGGNAPDSPNERPEAEIIRDLLVMWGVPGDKIVVETRSRNTWENAREIHALWKREPFGSALLVTSAAHMPRAIGVFRRLGLPVVPCSVDVHVVEGAPRDLTYWIPNAGALSQTTDAIRAWLGILVYRWRGWI